MSPALVSRFFTISAIWEAQSVKVLVTELYPTFCDLMDYNPQGCSVPGVVQTRILEWVVISFSRSFSKLKRLILSLLRCRKKFYRLSHQGRLYDPGISLWGIYPPNPKNIIWKHTCTPSFTGALFMIAKI